MSKNTVSIDVHMSVLTHLAPWAVVWSVFVLLDTSASGHDGTFPAADIVMALVMAYAYSLELRLFLLLTQDIGAAAVNRAWYLAGGTATFVMVLAVFIPGAIGEALGVENDDDDDNDQGKTLNRVVRARFVILVIFNVCLFFGSIGLYLTTQYQLRIVNPVSGVGRRAVLSYCIFMACVYGGWALAYGLQLSREDVEADAGICVGDATILVYFLGFPPIVYSCLKRDSQYWTQDAIGEKLTGTSSDEQMEVDEEDDSRMLQQWNDKSAIQEAGLFHSVFVPHRELFFRKALVNRMDVAVELHIWRRRLVVLKNFKLDFLTRENIVFFRQEADLLRRLLHPNIVQFLGVVINPPNMGIMMEYCKNGDLMNINQRLLKDFKLKSNHFRRLLRNKSLRGSGTSAFETAGQIDVSVINAQAQHQARKVSGLFVGRLQGFDPLRVMREISAGMKYLHDKGLIHRDLKSPNVLLDATWTAKIVDFGDATQHRGRFQKALSMGTLIRSSRSFPEDGPIETSKQDFMEMENGTASWAAPELIQGSPPTSKVDVYSFGVVLWEILTFEVPFLYLSASDIHGAVSPEIRESLVSTSNTMEGSDPNDELDFFRKSEGDKPTTLNSMNADAIAARKARYWGTEHLIDSPASSTRHSFRRSDFAEEPAVPLKAETSSDKEYSRGHDVEQPDSRSASPSLHGLRSNSDKKPTGNGEEETHLQRCEIQTPAIAKELVVDLGLRPPRPMGIPQRMSELLHACLSATPESRPSFSEICRELDAVCRNREQSLFREDFPFRIAPLVNRTKDEDILRQRPSWSSR
uniref:Protein kinase domain-containing protein n=1 Tax=Pinguiococcus pyrenoidosus TaxID=172671 RepID=A0A7R9U874_9STRA